MKIKEYPLLATLTSIIALPLVAHGAPLVSIGDNVDVFFNGSSTLTWNSNVFYDEQDDVDDLMLTVSPGFEVNVGRGISNMDLSIITRYDIVSYDELSELDDDYFHIKAIGSYKASRWDLNGLVSFDEDRSTTGQEGAASFDADIIDSDKTRADLNGEYRMSKFSVGTGINYSNKEYIDIDGLADQEIYRIPVDLFYVLTPKVDLSVGYAYKTTDVGNTSAVDSYDRDSHFFNVGARGNLLPKLTGFFKVGYSTLDSSRQGQDSSSTLGLDADFTYLVRPKVTTRLNLHHGFGVGSQGQGTERTSADLSAIYTINSNYSASTYFSYLLRDYEESNRKDTTHSSGVRFSYVPNQYWRFSTGYAYSENDSNRLDQSYEAHSLNLSASLRY